MKRTAVFALLAVFVAAGSAAFCATAPRTLLFEAVPGEGADKQLATQVTLALRQYIRSMKKTQVETFVRESPSVERAIVEKRLTVDQVASYATRQDRIFVGKQLGFDYIAGSDITLKDETLTVTLWIAKPTGKKSPTWQSEKSARARGNDLNKINNAVQTAASAAVHELIPKALANAPALPDAPDDPKIEIAAPTPSPDVPAVESPISPPTVAPPAPEDYLKLARASVERNELAQAIDLYARAVNLDPKNPELRLEFADVYARKGMQADASRELDAAKEAGADPAKVQEIASRIAEGGSSETTDDVPAADATPDKNPPSGRSPSSSKGSSDAVAAKISEGDKLWKKNQMAQAIQAYKQAMAIGPRDPRGIERLTLALAAVGKFGDAKVALAELKRVSPHPSADALLSRYRAIRLAVDVRLGMIINQFKSDYNSFNQKRLSREKFHGWVEEVSGSLEDMASFVDAIQVPQDRKDLNLRRSLACGLASQAADSMMDYLESDNATALSNAQAFISEADSELKAIGEIEPTGRVTQPR